MDLVPGTQALEDVAGAARALQPEHGPGPLPIGRGSQDVPDVPLQHVPQRGQDVAPGAHFPVRPYVDHGVPQDARRVGALQARCPRPQVAADVVQFVARKLSSQARRERVHDRCGRAFIWPDPVKVSALKEVEPVVREIARKVAAEPGDMIDQDVQVACA